MSDESPKPRSSPRRLRTLRGMNTVVSGLLALLVLVMVNYLAARHYVRHDVSRLKAYSLSPKTRTLLASLSNRVEVTVLFDFTERCYTDIDNLLKSYASRSRYLSVDRIDPKLDVARAAERVAALGIREDNVVVFSCEGRRRSIRLAELMPPVPEGQPRAFYGETLFTSALLEVTRPTRPVLYFLKGDGERDLLDLDPRRGYSGLRDHLESAAYELRTLDTALRSDIPEDAGAVVIAGPVKTLSVTTIQGLREYLKRDGRLLVLLDERVNSGLEPLLAEWGIHVGRNIVVDRRQFHGGKTVVVSRFGSHPMMRVLQGLSCVFLAPRAIEPFPSTGDPREADRPRVVSVVQSPETTWADVDVDQQPPVFDAGRDVPGPISLAVVAEHTPAQTLDVAVQAARMVVMGDADFLANGVAGGGNYDLCLTALGWLLDEREVLAISPKKREQARLVMDASQLRWLLLALVVVAPGLVAVAGFMVWVRRRR